MKGNKKEIKWTKKLKVAVAALATAAAVALGGAFTVVGISVAARNQRLGGLTAGSTADNNTPAIPTAEGTFSAGATVAGVTYVTNADAWTAAVEYSITNNTVVQFDLTKSWTGVSATGFGTATETNSPFGVAGSLNVPEGANIILNISPKVKLDRNVGATAISAGSVITVGGGTLYLTGGGIITGGNTTSMGGGISVYAGTVNMYSAVITKNNTTSYGGGAVIYERDNKQDSPTFNMYGGVISNNTATLGLGAVHTYGIFNGFGGEVCGNSSSKLGGGLGVGGASARLYLGTEEVESSIKIHDNTATTSGGGVYVNGDAALHINGASIYNNKAASNGGGVYVDTGTVTIKSGTISGNKADERGGGVHVNPNATFIMNGGMLSGNEAAQDGGGVYNRGTLTLSGTAVISGNKCKYGGGIWVLGTLNLGTSTEPSTVVISNNTATYNGGGIFAHGDSTSHATINIYDGEISNNTAKSGNGGGVYANENVIFNMTGGTIEGNTAKNSATGAAVDSGRGGGIFVYKGDLKLSDTAKIINNIAERAGGGLGISTVYGTHKVEILGGEFSGNEAKQVGGAIYAYDSSVLTLENVEILNNSVTSSSPTAAYGGGGIAVNTSAKLTIKTGTLIDGNTSADCGGGIFAMQNTTISITGGTISNNSAVNGGGIYTINKTVTIANCTIKENHATGSGGGVMITSTSNVAGTVTISKSTISNNSTNGNGGGIYFSSADADGNAYANLMTLNIGSATDSTDITNISGNTAYGANGGGVYVHRFGAFTMNDGIIRDNTAKNGAGVYVFAIASENTIGTFEMNGGTISGNTATGYGGGVYNMGTFTMDGGTIDGNTATGQGGGVYVNAGTLTMTSGTISGNTSVDTGGVCNNGGTFNLSGTAVISGNTSINYGSGGVCNNGTFTMSGGTISGNEAAQQGGGVYNMDTFNMTDGTIDGNTAANGGGVYVNAGTFTMTGGTISENTAVTSGGGIYVNTTGAFEMTGGTISDNSAVTNGGGIYSIGTCTMSDGTISGNEASHAGGVCAGAQFNMTGGAIIGNTVTENGGGVFIGSAGVFTMSGTATITGNTASRGGGVYVNTANSVMGTFTMSAGTVSGNTATVSGGGVFVNGTFNVNGSPKIVNNTLADGVNLNNVYLLDNKNITVNGVLTSNARIGVITQSGSLRTVTTGFGGKSGHDASLARTVFRADADGVATTTTGTGSGMQVSLVAGYVLTVTDPFGTQTEVDIVKNSTVTIARSGNTLQIKDGAAIVAELDITGIKAGYEPYMYYTADTSKAEEPSVTMDGDKAVTIAYKAVEKSYKIYYIIGESSATDAELETFAKQTTNSSVYGYAGSGITDTAIEFTDNGVPFDTNGAYAVKTFTLKAHYEVLRVVYGGEEVEEAVVDGTGEQVIRVYLKARKYTITFVPNGATIPSGMTQADFVKQLEYGAKVTLPVENITKPANRFEGWYDNAEFEGNPVDFTKDVLVRGETTYYAKWHEEGYPLIFHYDEKGAGDNGTYEYGPYPGTNENVIIYKYRVPGEVYEDDDYEREYFHYEEADNPSSFPVATAAFTFKSPTAEGFKFIGWYNSAGTKVEGVRKNATRGVEVWARWEPAQYKVTFDADGGTVVPKAQYYTNTHEFGSLPTPQKTGYTFDGWYPTDGGFDEVTEDTIALLKGETELKARWTPLQYIIDFDVETDESGAPLGTLVIGTATGSAEWVSGKKHDYGEKVTLRVTAKGGYTIDTLEIKRGTQNYVDLVNGSERTIVSDLTIRARFKVQNYNITYTYDGGTPVGTAEKDFVRQYSSLSDADTALPGKSEVYKKGYTLAGWKLKGADASFNTVGGIRDALKDRGEQPRNVVLVADWNPTDRTVWLHKNDLPGVDRYETVTSDDKEGGQTVATGLTIKIQLEDTSTMDNYVLLGWATSANSRSIAVPVGTDESDRSTYGIGYYTVKVEDDEDNTLENSVNQLYAVWHVKGEQTLLMSSDAPNGATEVTYTGNAFHITAQPMQAYEADGGEINLRYQWFRNGKLVKTETKNSTKDNKGDKDWTKVSLEVKNVADSGTYTCLLTVTGSISGETSTSADGEIEVTIHKTDYTAFEFNNELGVSYDGDLHTNYVTYGANLNKVAQNYIEIGTNKADWIKVTYTYELDGEIVTENGAAATSVRNAGTYTVTAHFEVPANSNYNDIEDQISLYEIVPVTIKNITYELWQEGGTSAIETEDFVVKYNGKKYIVKAVSNNILSGDVVIIDVRDGEATAVGVYEATLAGTLSGKDGGNYAFEETSLTSRMYESRRYEIERADHDLTGVTFGDLTKDYDGNLYEIFVKKGETAILDGGSLELADGSTVTVNYTISVTLHNESYTDAQRTGNGGSAAGEYVITATFTDSEANAANYVAIDAKSVTLTINQADFFGEGNYNRDAMLGGFVSANRGYSSTSYTKIEIDGSDNGKDFNSEEFRITYVYEQWISGSYSAIFDGNTQEYGSFQGVRVSGNYRIRAHIEYVDEGLKNNYGAIEDIEIAYNIASGIVESITVTLDSDYDGHRYGEAFDVAAISQITVVYDEGPDETFSGEAISGIVIREGNGGEFTTFKHVGSYGIKVEFLGVTSDEITVTVKQEINEITSWEYRVTGTQTWTKITEAGIEYSASGYEFRGVYSCVNESGSNAADYVTATAPATLNVREAAYTLTANGTKGNYIFVNGEGGAITGEVRIIKNTKESVKWYYNNGTTEVEITDSTIVYNATNHAGKIIAKYEINGATQMLEWKLVDSEGNVLSSVLTNAGEYKLVASQANYAPNYALNGLEKTVKINAQVLGAGLDYVVKYQLEDGTWEELPSTLPYKGAAYNIRIEVDGKTIKVSGVGVDKIRDAKEYQLICGVDNYALAAGETLPALTITSKKITVNWNVPEHTYDGTEKTVTGSTDGAVGEDSDILTFIGNAHTNAGSSYLAVAQIAEAYAGNYEIIDGATQDWSISAKEIEITWGTTEFAYTGLPQTPVVQSTNIEACDSDKIVISLSYTFDGSDASRNEIVNVLEEGHTYGARAVFNAAPGVDPSVLSNYSYVNVSTNFTIVQADPDLGEVRYVEYKANDVYVVYSSTTRGLREDKIDYENKDKVKGSFKFLDNEGNEIAGSDVDINVGKDVLSKTFRLKFTPNDTKNYLEKELELTVIMRQDSSMTGANALLVDVAEGARQYIVGTDLRLNTISVYQKYASYYEENGVPYGRREPLDMSNVNLTINGANIKSGYKFTEDDLDEGATMGEVKISAERVGTSGLVRGESLPIVVSKLAPSTMKISNEDALREDWYEGETFDYSKLMFTVTYSNGTSGTISASMVTCTISDMSGKTFTAADAGEHTVTFDLLGAKATATINVIEKAQLQVKHNASYAFAYTGSTINWQSEFEKSVKLDGELKLADVSGITIEYLLTDSVSGENVTDNLVGVEGQEKKYNATVTFRVNNVKYKSEPQILHFVVTVTTSLYEIEFESGLPANGYEYRNAQIELPHGEIVSVTDKITNAEVTGVEFETKIFKGGEEVSVVRERGTYTLKVTFTLNGEKIGEKEYTFEVTQANNSISNFNVQSVKVGERVRPTASAKFGTVTYEYSTQRNGTYAAYTESTQLGAGIYYMRAVVAATDDYKSARSEAVRFTVNEVTISTTDKVEDDSVVEISDEVKGIEYGTQVATSKLEDLSEVKVGNTLAGYELTISGNTQPLEGVTVKLLISEELKGRTDLNVYYVDEEGNAKNMNAKVSKDGKYLEFTASGIGSGTLAITAKLPGQPVGLIVAVAVLGAVAAGGMVACCVVFAKKRRSN